MWIAYAVTLSIFVFHAASVKPEAMTRAVEQFEETTDLWKGLLQAGYLPGHHNTFTNTPPTNGWLDFLRTDGENVVQLSFDRTKVNKKTEAARLDFERLLQYARHPLAGRSFFVKHQVTRMVAGHLIKKYAVHLESNPRNVLVYRALKRTHLALGGKMPELADAGSVKLERDSASRAESSLATSLSDYSDTALARQPSKSLAELYQD